MATTTTEAATPLAPDSILSLLIPTIERERERERGDSTLRISFVPLEESPCNNLIVTKSQFPALAAAADVVAYATTTPAPL